jgi:PAS domain S-box-containing protein
MTSEKVHHHLPVFLAIAGVIVFSSLFTYMMSREALLATESISQNQSVLITLERTLSTLKDAETGQRGYLLTGDEKYLAPYDNAVRTMDVQLASLQTIADHSQNGAEEARLVRTLARRKLDELARTIELRRTQGLEPALQLVRTNEGIEIMDSIRTAIENLGSTQSKLLAQSEEANTRAVNARNWAFGTTLLLNLAILGWAFRRVSSESQRRHLAAEEAARQRELLGMTLSSIVDSVFTTDNQTHITLMNPSAAALVGTPSDAARGRSLRDVLILHDETTGERLECPAARVLRTGQGIPTSTHAVALRTDGTRVAVEFSAFPKRRENESASTPPRGVVVTVRDLTPARKAAEEMRLTNERLRLVLDAAGLGTFDYDVPMSSARWDGTIARHFFTDLMPDVPFEHIISRIHAEDRDRVVAAIDRAREQKVKYEAQYRTVASDDYITEPGEPRTRWIQAIGKFYYDREGKPVRFSGVTMDITARREAELALREANARAESARSAAETALTAAQQARLIAENAGRAKDQFLAALSHELRTPLTPVLASLSSLESLPGLDAGQQDLIRTTRRNVELEARLIDDLLDLTRVVQGKLILDLETVDAHEAIHRATEIVRSEANARAIQVIPRLDAARHFVRADATRLQQVFWNILRNAAKFSPERQGRVEITSRNDEHGNLEIAFTDNGIGMTPDIIAKLFKPFEQGSELITRRFGGLGLGLAISKALVDRQSGTLTASSPGLGFGSTFTVCLPVVAQPAHSAASSSNRQPTSARTLRILLVEDHADTAKTMAMLLSRFGHTVTTAHTAAEALHHARNAAPPAPSSNGHTSPTSTPPFDLILSDVGLPDMTGLDLIREIRTFSSTPAIALTGFGMEEDMARTAEAGFNAHLTKPVNLARLRAVMEQVTSE